MADLLLNRFVLIADDDSDDLRLFHDAIREIQSSVQIVTVGNGEQLLHTLHELRILPDVIFLDLNMPLMNGVTCLAEIKRSLKLQSIPVVVFSTTMDEETIDGLYEKGASCYVVKPNDFSVFLEDIQLVFSLIFNAVSSSLAREHFVL